MGDKLPCDVDHAGGVARVAHPGVRSVRHELVVLAKRQFESEEAAQAVVARQAHDGGHAHHRGAGDKHRGDVDGRDGRKERGQRFGEVLGALGGQDGGDLEGVESMHEDL